MKKIILYTILILSITSCNDNFLELYPEGYINKHNYTGNEDIDPELMIEGKFAQTYGVFREWGFVWNGLGIHNFPTPDAYKGSHPGDAPIWMEFENISYGASNPYITDYYQTCFRGIRNANEAITMALALSDTIIKKPQYLAEAIFLRSAFYFYLTQAYGAVPYYTRVLGKDEASGPRLSRTEMWQKLEKDFASVIPTLPTRSQLLASGNGGRATQNAAHAFLAKVYLYQKKWTQALEQTTAVINSGDNNLSTKYEDIYSEAAEFGPESVFEIYCEFKPATQINLGSQYGTIIGFRGTPNLGWGFDAPTDVLMNAFEAGDPRKAATVLHDGDVLEGVKFIADATSYKYFNKKGYVRQSERGVYGRSAEEQGQWKNIRLIRYADVVLMHAEAACELGNTTEALNKLEMVRARARGGNNAVLLKITTTDQTELRAKIHQERRIELALEWERFFDLIRWGETSEMPNFKKNKNELYPIPQAEIDKSGGVLTQNPGY